MRAHVGQKPFGTLEGHDMKLINLQYQDLQSWGKYVLYVLFIFDHFSIENNRKCKKMCQYHTFQVIRGL